MTLQVENLVSVQEWDGADRHYHRFYLRDIETAKRYKAEVDKFCHLHEVSLIICDNLQDVAEWKNGDLKRKALAKLTEADKTILGLK